MKATVNCDERINSAIRLCRVKIKMLLTEENERMYSQAANLTALHEPFKIPERLQTHTHTLIRKTTGTGKYGGDTHTDLEKNILLLDGRYTFSGL